MGVGVSTLGQASTHPRRVVKIGNPTYRQVAWRLAFANTKSDFSHASSEWLAKPDVRLPRPEYAVARVNSNVKQQYHRSSLTTQRQGSILPT